MNLEELKKHIEWLEYEYKNTHPSDRESRGQLLIALNNAKSQLGDGYNG